MDWVVKMPKKYFKMLNNHSLLKEILLSLYKYANILVIKFKKLQYNSLVSGHNALNVLKTKIFIIIFVTGCQFEPKQAL